MKKENYGLKEVLVRLKENPKNADIYDRLKEELNEYGITVKNRVTGNTEEALVISDRPLSFQTDGERKLLLIGIVEDANTENIEGAVLLTDEPSVLTASCLLRTWCHEKNLPFRIAENEELYLSELSEEDIESVIRLMKEEHIRKFVPEALEDPEILRDKLLSHIGYSYRFFEVGIWGVFLKKTGKLIGAVSLERKEGIETSEFELGFMTDRLYLRKGYGIMAVHLALSYAREELGIRRFFARTHKRNEGAKALLKKAGFFACGEREDEMEQHKREEEHTMNELPKEPTMLLSFVNMKLRDRFPTLERFCKAFGIDEKELTEKLREIDYIYDETLNKFI